MTEATKNGSRDSLSAEATDGFHPIRDPAAL